MSRRDLSRLLLAFLLAAAMWSYVSWVLIPYERAEAARKDQPRGMLSDLYPRWLGAREFLLHQRDPYSAEITREIQVGYWGRVLDSRRPNDPRDQDGFAYPAYVVFLLAPFIRLPFPLVQAMFSILLGALTALSVPLWLRALQIQWTPSARATAMVLAVGSWPVVQALHLQQLTLLVAALLAASAFLVRRGKLIAAGVVLAAATIKPQLAAPVALWFAVWTLGDWRRRYRLALSFVAAMAAILAATEVMMPGWFGHWGESLHAYLVYNHARPLAQVLLGPYLGRAAELGVVAVIALTCWRNRKENASSPAFASTLSVAVVAALLVMPKWASYDQVLLLPVALWTAARWRELRTLRISAQFFSYLFAALLASQWVTAAGLVVLAQLSPAATARLAALPLIAVLGLPAAAFCALALQAMRKQRAVAVTQSSAVRTAA